MDDFSDFKSTDVPIDQVIPYARNPRNNKTAISKVASSIKEYGFRQPIVVDKDMVVIVGHTRLEAARLLNLATVPVHIANGLSEIKAKAYRIADNRTHEESSWDNELLALELSELEESGIGLEATAFDTSELDSLLNEQINNSDKDIDSVPDISDNPVTKKGDIWQLGDHRLVCGDSGDPWCYEALFGAGKCDMIYTDPPYNVNYQSNAGKIKNDNLTSLDFSQLLEKVFRNCTKYLTEGGSVYVSYSEKETENFFKALRLSGLKQSGNLIWLKNQLVLGRSDYQLQHEPIWYGWKKGKKHQWHGGRKQTSISKCHDLLPVSKIDDNHYIINWNDLNVIIEGKDLKVEAVESSIIKEDKPLKSPLHPTMKPVSLIERLISNSSKRGNLVLDAFGGSGSTLIACEQVKRNARIIEIEPKYCDVIIKRWQILTGKQAFHAQTGSKFIANDD